MAKVEKGQQGQYLFPHPITLISAYDKNGKPNAYVTCWQMNIGHNPPKLALITRDFRYTYTLFKESGYFGVNIPSAKHFNEVDFFGQNSGKDIDKFEATGFTVFKGTKADIPLINECHVNFECKVLETKVIEDTLIIIFAEVLNTHYDEELLTENGLVDETKADMMVYGLRHYWAAKERIASVGCSKEKD